MGASKLFLKKHAVRLKAAVIALFDDQVSTHSAALAFYSIFSIAPIVIIAIAFAGIVLGPQSQGEVYPAISNVIGASGAQAIHRLVLSAARHRGSGKTAAIGGIATLLFGASAAFQQMEQSLNTFWRVEGAPGRGLWTFFRQRLLSFSLVLVIGFLLLVSLIVSAAIAALGTYLGNRLPGGEVFWHVINFTVTFGFITVLFSAIFKILPDVRLRWKDVWLGGAAASFLFGIGKFGIGLYLGKSSVASSYGAAGSLVVILLWVYYSSFILFFGAELTRIYATSEGKAVEPRSGSRYGDSAKAA